MDFLNPHAKSGTPEIDMDIHDPEFVPGAESSQDKLIKFWKKTQRVLDKFWLLWHTEYIRSLRERYKSTHSHKRNALTITPKPGEIVLVEEPNVPRAEWRLARVTKLVASKDNNIRVAKIKVSTGRELIRPISLLYSLELSEIH